jgi:hypothetical protein
MDMILYILYIYSTAILYNMRSILRYTASSAENISYETKDRTLGN